MALSEKFSGTKADCDEIQRLLDKELGFPQKSVVGPFGLPPNQQEFVIQDEWDGTGPTPQGWTKTYDSVEPDGENFMIEMPDLKSFSKLTVQEQTFFASKRAQVVVK
jgi:hypothetical protein